MKNPWPGAIRIHTLPVGATPVIMGIALAKFQFMEINYPIAFLTLLCCLLMQAGSNLVNDYFDGIRGTDNDQRIGFTRATASGALPASIIKKAYQFCFLFAFLIGLYLSYHGGIFIFSLGMLSLLAAYLYTGGPFPFSHHGLGEVFAFIFFGPVAVMGSNYLQSHTINYLSIMIGMIPGFLAAAIMAINNLRDRKQDKQTGKTTLANLTDETKARYLVIIMILLSNITIMILSFYELMILIGLIPFFIFFKNWKIILSEPVDGRMNLALKNTGKYLTLTGLLVSFGLLHVF